MSNRLLHFLFILEAKISTKLDKVNVTHLQKPVFLDLFLRHQVKIMLLFIYVKLAISYCKKQWKPFIFLNINYNYLTTIFMIQKFCEGNTESKPSVKIDSENKSANSRKWESEDNAEECDLNETGNDIEDKCIADRYQDLLTAPIITKVFNIKL